MTTQIPMLDRPVPAGELVLRPYQAWSVDELARAKRDGHLWTILCAPTGSGKTEISIHLIDRARKRGMRIAFVCDRRTLVDQTRKRFAAYGIPHGVAMAEKTFGRSMPIQICSAQTIEKRGYWPTLDLLVIDEAHTQRKGVLEFAKAWGGPVIGLTATPLTEGLGQWYSKVVNAVTTDRLLADGYLAPLKIFAATEIDMRGAKKTAGEWQSGEVRERGRKIVGDIVSTYERMTRQHFGGPVKTLLFSADIAHGEELCRAFQAAGHDFRQSTYHDGTDETEAMVEGFRRGDFMGLVSVEKFCLDEETEVLTSDGWIGMTGITSEHAVANFWSADGRITFAKPKDVIHRVLRPTDDWVTHPRGIKVTADHRMLVRSRGAISWKTVPANALIGRRMQIPDCGVAEPFDVDTPECPHPESDEQRRLSVNSYHLRRQGMGVLEAREEARARIARRDSLTYVPTEELTIDQCRFIGFWLGDGTTLRPARGGIGYRIDQSLAYPSIVEWVDALCERLDYDYARRVVPPSGKTPHNSVSWRFSRGTGFGPQAMRGLFELEPYLDKNGSPLLWGLDVAQFDALIEGVWMADGDHSEQYAGDSRGRRIGSVRKHFVDLLQAIAVCREFRATVRPGSAPKQPNHRQSFYLWISKKDSPTVTLGQQHVPQFTTESAGPGDLAWCVETDSGYIVIRRDGYVSVVGNCKGFDVPDVLCMIGARPYSSSLASVIQQMGRGMRTAEGKDFCLYLDHAGNVAGWYDDVMDFWANGVDRLDVAEKRKPKRREGEDRPDVVCDCGYVLQPGMQSCPSCGAARRRRRTRAEVVPGRMEEWAPSQSAEWMKDESWVWSQLCRLALERTNGDSNTAQGKAAGYYKGMYSRFPKWGRPLKPCDGPVDERVSKRVQHNLIRYRYAKSRRAA